jgi:hypothetical protein
MNKNKKLKSLFTIQIGLMIIANVIVSLCNMDYQTYATTQIAMFAAFAISIVLITVNDYLKK